MSVIDHRIAARLAGGLFVLGTLAPIAVAGAQSSPVSGDGFLFHRPSGSVVLRGGFSRPFAGSDVYSFASKQLTLDKGDFGTGSVSADVFTHLTDRMSLQFSLGYSGRKINSEFRDWVDNNDRPIEQSTELRRLPITLGLRYYLTSPGRSLGRLAWVPARVTPYVSAGAGTMWYRFRQAGDFVDYQTLDVFNTELVSNSWTPAGYGAVGSEFSMSASTAFVAEARYDVAHARMSQDFEGFHRIDLSGLTATVGMSIRF